HKGVSGGGVVLLRICYAGLLRVLDRGCQAVTVYRIRRRKRDHSLLANSVGLLVSGLLAGLVVAGVAFPAVALSGLLAKTGADGFDRLPGQLVVQQSPQISYVYASDHK